MRKSGEVDSRIIIVHFLLHCTFYNDIRAETFNEQLSSDHFNNMNETDKFNYL